ncbi:hypothetical protein FB45DRAFT_228986 [Roridomyces roridus]|uniref:Secreted protein n=1 Tax=Roridomyces roridus TaxID=1738132 RepID=A0AAD7FF44_9AGAR|nr:hypothetical protein FB45DRAFT_228986 [Roridomyces roridus]
MIFERRCALWLSLAIVSHLRRLRVVTLPPPLIKKNSDCSKLCGRGSTISPGPISENSAGVVLGLSPLPRRASSCCCCVTVHWCGVENQRTSPTGPSPYANTIGFGMTRALDGMSDLTYRANAKSPKLSPHAQRPHKVFSSAMAFRHSEFLSRYP